MIHYSNEWTFEQISLLRLIKIVTGVVIRTKAPSALRSTVVAGEGFSDDPRGCPALLAQA